MEQKSKLSRANFTPQQLLAKGPWIYLLTTLFTLILFFIFRSQLAFQSSISITLPAIGIILVLAIGAFIWHQKHPLSIEVLCCLIFIVALLVHLSYTFYTGPYIRQHDVYGYIDHGHMGYIAYIYQNKSLPDFVGYQYYHPPLHHILSAILMEINTKTSGSISSGIESLRFLPFLYITWTTIVSYRLLSRLKISKNALLLSFSFIAFHPTMSVLSSSINNDALAFFFTIAAFYRMIVWYQEPTKKNILVLALLLAGAALSKISSLQLALPIGFLFLVMLLAKYESEIRGKLTAKKLWGQYILFAIISIPLSLSYSIRNKILFNQDLGYVPTIGDETLDQYVGNYSFFDRFMKPFSKNLWKNAYCQIPGDYNVYEYLLRCSIFGEFSYSNGDLIARFLTILNALIILGVIAALIVVTVSKVRMTKDGLLWLSFSLYAITLWVAYILFNISFPFACTMDFRYLLPMIILAGIFLAGFYDWLSAKDCVLRKGIRISLVSIITMFSVGCSVFYLMAK